MLGRWGRGFQSPTAAAESAPIDCCGKQSSSIIDQLFHQGSYSKYSLFQRMQALTAANAGSYSKYSLLQRIQAVTANAGSYSKYSLLQQIEAITVAKAGSYSKYSFFTVNTGYYSKCRLLQQIQYFTANRGCYCSKGRLLQQIQSCCCRSKNPLLIKNIPKSVSRTNLQEQRSLLQVTLTPPPPPPPPRPPCTHTHTHSHFQAMTQLLISPPPPFFSTGDKPFKDNYITLHDREIRLNGLLRVGL